MSAEAIAEEAQAHTEEALDMLDKYRALAETAHANIRKLIEQRDEAIAALAHIDARIKLDAHCDDACDHHGARGKISCSALEVMEPAWIILNRLKALK